MRRRVARAAVMARREQAERERLGLIAALTVGMAILVEMAGVWTLAW